MIQKHIIILPLLLLLIIGCGHSSPGIDSPKEKAEPQVESTAEPELFNTAGISRVSHYLKTSKVAYDNTLSLGMLSKMFKLHYDWKQSKPYLKGGKKDIVGRILYVLALTYRADEIHEALIDILHTPAFLKEILDFFTSEALLTPEQQKTLHAALEEKDMKSLETMIDTIYANFFIHFDHFYNTEGKWTENTETHEWTFEEGGFEDFYIKKYLEVASKEEGSPPQKSDIRVSVVQFITTLVQKYINTP